MASALIFYTNPLSRGRIVRWMLEETGVPYETVVLEYMSSMKQEEYLSINPMSKVPAIGHDGRIITECAAICAYLADAFPDARLAPPTTDRADYYRWLFFAAGPVEQAVTHKSMNITPDEQQRRLVGYGHYDLMVDVLEKAVSASPYIAGDVFTAADIYVGSQINWGTQFGTLPKRAAFMDYVERLTARDAYQRAAAKDDALMPAADPAG